MKKIINLTIFLILILFMRVNESTSISTPQSSVYRKISMIEFDSFDMEDTREINRLRRKDNLPLLRYSVDLIDFAQQESERLANLSRFDSLNFAKITNQTEHKKLFAYVIKYTGQLMVDSSMCSHFISITYS